MRVTRSELRRPIGREVQQESRQVWGASNRGERKQIDIITSRRISFTERRVHASKETDESGEGKIEREKRRQKKRSEEDPDSDGAGNS